MFFQYQGFQNFRDISKKKKKDCDIYNFVLTNIKLKNYVHIKRRFCSNAI